MMAAMTPGSPAARLPGDEPMLMEADERRCLAMQSGDVNALDALLHDSLVYVHSSGTVHDKAGFLRSIAQGQTFYASIRRELHHLQRHGDVAILQGRCLMHITHRQQPRVLDILFLSAWVHTDAGWVMTAWASTPQSKSVG